MYLFTKQTVVLLSVGGWVTQGPRRGTPTNPSHLCAWAGVTHSSMLASQLPLFLSPKLIIPLISLLSMPNCPAGVALDSRVLAPLRWLRLAWGGEGGGVGGESAQLWRSPAFSQVGSQEMGDSPTQCGHTLSPNCAPLRCFRNRF